MSLRLQMVNSYPFGTQPDNRYPFGTQNRQLISCLGLMSARFQKDDRYPSGKQILVVRQSPKWISVVCLEVVGARYNISCLFKFNSTKYVHFDAQPLSGQIRLMLMF